MFLWLNAAFAQTVHYSDLLKGGKLPYGKNVTLIGNTSDLKCGPAPITDLLSIAGISAYAGQTTPNATGTISGNKWTVPLGQLPPGTAINLTLRVTGKIAGGASSVMIDRSPCMGPLLGALRSNLVPTAPASAEMNVATVTADLQKYAGFDAGAVYVPRLNELRDSLTAHIYLFGPVDLDPNGVANVNWKNRLSIAIGATRGEISANANSRIANNQAYLYGVGFRLNKYFRVSAGGLLYRDAKPGSGLLNELFIGPSIDLTALPGLKQIFAN